MSHRPKVFVNDIIIDHSIRKAGDPTYLKRYKKGHYLGKGGFAMCYEMQSFDTQRRYAGKIIPKTSLTKTSARNKLLNEIKIHRSLNYQNVVKFERFFEDKDNVYILLELCTNRTLMELVKRRKRLTETETQFYMWQLLETMEHLHGKNVIHRDLKLGNLFLDRNLNIKVGDFGLAARLSHKEERKRTICGTPNYIAPEILDSKNGHSFEVDTWSMGVIMYTLLIGKPPFETRSVKTTYSRIRANSYIFPLHVPISRAAQELISMILHSRPEMRPSLAAIKAHPFFHNGKFPQHLPLTCLTTPLEYDGTDPTDVSKALLYRKKTSTGKKSSTGLSSASSSSSSSSSSSASSETAAAAACVRRPLAARSDNGNTAAYHPTNAGNDAADGLASKSPASGAAGTTTADGPVTRAQSRGLGNGNAGGTGTGENEKSLRSQINQKMVRAEEVLRQLQSLDIGQQTTTATTTGAHKNKIPPTSEAGELDKHKRPRTAGASDATAARKLALGAADIRMLGKRGLHYASKADKDEEGDMRAIHDDIEQSFCQHPKPSQAGAKKHGGSTKASGPAAANTANNSQPTPTVPQANRLWVNKWVDYSNKYGLGYLLSNNNSGVYFNDSSKAILHENGENFEYVEARSSSSAAAPVAMSYLMTNYPPHLQKKVTLLKHFMNYLVQHKKDQASKKTSPATGTTATSRESKTTSEQSSDTGGMVYVKKWLRTKHAILFRLSNRTVQVIFYDHTEVILSSEDKQVTYTNKARKRETYALDTVFSNPRPDLAKRLKYTKDILYHLLSRRAPSSSASSRPATALPLGANANKGPATGVVR